MATPFRAIALRFAVGEANKHVIEHGENTGPEIKEYQAADGVKFNPDTGYPYCAAGVCWSFDKAGRPLVELKESPSVGILLSYARKHEWNVAQPQPGDCVCFYWGPDDWPDHIGFVKTVGPTSLTTVEFNTSLPGKPEGVYVRSRPRSLRMSFFRVPGEKKDAKPGPRFQILRGERVVATFNTLDAAQKKMRELFAKGAKGMRIKKLPPKKP